MRLQHVAIFFVLIFMPILLITSYFISLQVETIKLESSYDEKLLKATHDAMTAFELNTANEDLSTVSDSLRSIIDASNNIFFNTLCTNLGVSNASKSYVEPYIPAILYTLYDGYYIYSPTNVPEICVDKYGRTIRTSDYGVRYTNRNISVNGNEIGIYEFNQDAIIYDTNSTTEPIGLNNNNYQVDYNVLETKGLEGEYSQILYKNNDGTYSTQLHIINGNRAQSTYYKRDYILKSYIPYSARYTDDSSYDITINYTLDNFMTVEGTVDGIYYTKSGYLIKDGLVKEINIRGTKTMTISSWKQISEDVIDEYIHDPINYEVTVLLEDGVKISNRDGRVDYFAGSSYWDDAQSAVEYYVDSYIFSGWFYDNFSDIQAKSLKNTEYSVSDITDNMLKNLTKDGGNKITTKLYSEMLYDFSSDTTKIFSQDDADGDGNIDNDPESEESVFYEHKRNVIKNSITYNLILSMLVYTEESKTIEFNMPVLKEEEWDAILNNVTIVSFMEGMKCGLKFYNNYAIVTSTNNEISVTDNEIYYVPRVLEPLTDGSGNSILANLEDNDILETAHRIDCEDLVLAGPENFQFGNWLGCISFKSKEIKYDKILESNGEYTYDHKAYTDYNCIVDSNYTAKNRDGTELDGNTDIVKYLLDNKVSSRWSVDYYSFRFNNSRRQRY